MSKFNSPHFMLNRFCILNILNSYNLVMNYSNLFEKHMFSPQKLLDFGFIKDKNTETFVILKPMKYSTSLFLNVEINLNLKTFNVKVMDLDFEEEYVLANLSQNSENKINYEIQNIIDEITSECSDEITPYLEIRMFIEQNYGQNGVNEDGFLTYKVNDRVFASFSEDFFGGPLIDLKVPMQVLNSLIDHKHIFDCLHPFEGNWISICLDEDADLNKIKALIDKSYQIVSKK